MTSMKHDNVIITAVTATGRAAPGVGIVAVVGVAVWVASTIGAEVSTVLNWVVGGFVVMVVSWFGWQIRDDIPRPGEARRVAQWSAAVDTALYLKAWDDALAEDAYRRQLEEAARELDEPTTAELPAAGLIVPDELAARRAEREAS
jgi:hypothetical protein